MLRDPRRRLRWSATITGAVVAGALGGAAGCTRVGGVEGGLDGLDAGPDAGQADPGHDAGRDDPGRDDAGPGDAGMKTTSDAGPSCADCDADERCLDHPGLGITCVTDCPETRRCGGGRCCPLGSTCQRDGRCRLANLTIDADRVARSVDLRTRHFRAGSCAWEEGCVEDFGDRRLLRFDLRTPNEGRGDLYMGDPDATPELFEYSSCHEHFHFLTFAAYELRAMDGTVAARGHKQSFCLIDVERFDRDARREATYDCQIQGISAGWADVYHKSLDCQWVDVTGVPAGDYLLRVEINTERVLAESNYDDNVVEVPVRID